MVLFVNTEELDSKKLISAVKTTFKRRNTHEFNSKLVPPPATWKAPFAKLAEDCDISRDIDSGFELVREFIAKVFS